MRMRSALLAATILSIPVAVQAQPVNGLYVGAGAGFNYKQDQAFDSFNANVGPLAPAATNGLGLKLKYNIGWVGSPASVTGLATGCGLRWKATTDRTGIGTLHGTAFPTASGGNEQYLWRDGQCAV